MTEFDQVGAELVTAVKEYDGPGAGWELPRGTKRFFVGGSQSCEIAVPGRGLSATHCLLERRGRGMRLYDEHSAYGTWVKDAPIATADLRPGDKFTPKPVTLVAMNDAMRIHRPTLVEIVGADWVPSPDWLMVESYNSSHMIIAGEPGCDQVRLARAIHAISPRRSRPLVEIDAVPEDREAGIAIVKQASKQAGPNQRTTIMLTLGARPTPLDEPFLSMLYSATYGIRVIVLAGATEDARRALGEARAGLCQQVLLRPLALRATEIDHLVDRRFAEGNVTHLRAADLAPENQDALRAYHWPGNLVELRLVAEVIVAHETLGGWRPASDAVQRKKTTLQEHFDRIGLALISGSFFKTATRDGRDRFSR